MSHATNWDYGMDPPGEPLPWCTECDQERDPGEMVVWHDPDWRYPKPRRDTGVCVYCQPPSRVDE